MKTIKWILILLIVGLTFMSMDDCSNANDGKSRSEEKQEDWTNDMMDEAQRQAGLPNIVNFQERKLTKQIFEMRDQADLVCYAYIQSEHTGKLIYIGRCLGFGIPASVQYTTPTKLEYFSHGGVGEIPQADPNMLYMPTGLSATWLMLYDAKKKEYVPAYFEPLIVVSPIPLTRGVAN